MLNFFNQYLTTFLIYFPIGIIGIWRWGVWSAKKIVAKNYRSVEDNGYKDSLSIVTPVYNEEPGLFIQAIESWIENKPDEIIAVIDYSDIKCIEIFKKFQNKYPICKLIITKRPGKREALADGIRRAKSNIVALIDSDTVWDKNIKESLMHPFKDSRVGGVGPRQDILTTDTISRRLFNIHLDHRYYDEITYLATVGDALTCISGRTAFYRKSAIFDLCDELENEKFWGKKCISGDDKCLTRLVQERGWLVKYQGNNCVRTPGAPTIIEFLKQQIRWMRNSYRSDLKTIFSKWVWKREKLLAYHMIDRFTQPFTLLLGPIYLMFSIIWGHWFAVAILLTWWYFSRGIKLYPHLKHRPSDIIFLPVYILFTYVLAILKIYAILTIGRQGWMTRWHKDRLENKGRYVIKVVYFLTPHFATLFILFSLGLFVVAYKDFTTSNLSTENSASAYTSNIQKHEKIISQNEKTILQQPEKEELEVFIYEIKKDDTLNKIAKRFSTNIHYLKDLNSKVIKNPDLIIVGNLILVPEK